MKIPFCGLQVWIINLNRSHDRWQRCLSELTQVFPVEQVQRVNALDGFDFLEGLEERTRRWNSLIRSNLEREGKLSSTHPLDPVYTALCLSHQKALQQFLDSGEEWGLIFEDDACLGDSALQVMREDGDLPIPRDAELLFLHGRVRSRKLRPNSPVLKETANSLGLEWRLASGGIGLEAYAVSRVGARKILAAWQPVVMECDLQLMTFLQGRISSQQVREIHEMLGKSEVPAAQLIKAYALNRPLFCSDRRARSVKLAIIAEAGGRSFGAHAGGGPKALGNPLATARIATDVRQGLVNLRRLSGPRAFRRLPLSATARLWGHGRDRQGAAGRAFSLAPVRFSFCITAKDRADQLHRTLPHNLEVVRRSGDCELMLLDYNSRDGLEEHVLDHFKAELRSGLLRFARTRSPDKFHRSHAKNLCHRLGRGEYLINLDADHFLNEAYLRELSHAVTSKQADVCQFVYDSLVFGGGFGRIVIQRDWFERLGGYDEEHNGYGYEDFDLVERARRKDAQVVLLSSATAEFLRHGDERRGLVEINRGVEEAHWKAFFKAKWARGKLIANKGRRWGVAEDLRQYPASNPHDLTVILTNYRRPDNIARILDSIPSGVEVILLDNAPTGLQVRQEVIRRVHWYLKSDGNDLVLRWLLAARVKTRYFCVQDDDLYLKDFKPYLQKLQQVNTLVGPFGVNLKVDDPKRCYSRGRHRVSSRECDVIKGRTVFGRVRELRRVMDLRDIDQVSMNNDDVFISSLFRRKHHAVEVPGNVVELPDNDAISRRRRHLDGRDVSAMKFFLERSVSQESNRGMVQRSSISRGVVLCASPSYHAMAMRAMESLRLSNPMLPVYCHPAAEGRASREAKLSMDEWSPFEETLFIDCDTLVCEDLMPMFGLLKDASLYMAKETPKHTTLGSVVDSGWIHREVSEEYLDVLKELPASTPQWNSGVILFHKDAATRAFFEAWRTRWRQRGSRTLDQLPLTELVVEQGPPAELPGYWHCQVSSQNPKAKIPDAAIYHFMGVDKESSYRRWRRSCGKMTELAMLNSKQPF